MSTIKPSLEDISEEVSIHKPILNKFSSKSQTEFSPLNNNHAEKKYSMRLNKQTNRSWQLTKFNQNQMKKLQGKHRSLHFLI